MVDHDDFRSPLAPDAHAGSVAIVTGGGTGIGRATAMELARTGAKVAICGRRPEPLEAVRQELDAAGSDCLAMSADVREAEQVVAFLEAVDERFGAVETVFRICDNELLNHQIEIVAGVLADDCRQIVQDFFRRKREMQKSKPSLES